MPQEMLLWYLYLGIPMIAVFTLAIVVGTHLKT
jgi:hypothetical protein